MVLPVSVGSLYYEEISPPWGSLIIDECESAMYVKDWISGTPRKVQGLVGRCCQRSALLHSGYA